MKTFFMVIIVTSGIKWVNYHLCMTKKIYRLLKHAHVCYVQVSSHNMRISDRCSANMNRFCLKN